MLKEIIDFIHFLKIKKIRGQDSLKKDLSILNKKEIYHLEEEVKNYKKLYPYEK